MDPLQVVRQEKLAQLARATAALEKKTEARICEDRLIDFAEYVWPVVEPAIPFIRGWVLETICEHLEAVTYGQIRRLLINVPPGFTKSLMTDVFWPAWEWGPQNMPHTRYLCAAYAEHLTVRDNMRCRNIIISDRYQRLWGDRFGVSQEQFSKIKFANDKTGWKLASSVGGIGTGERADRVIVDDPNNPMEVESEDVRNTTKIWFTEVLPDRLNNQAESAIVVIQQRTHEDDVSGIALARDMGYVHVCIPMLYVPSYHINGYTVNEHGKDEIVSIIGPEDVAEFPEEDVFWVDKRTEDGELAWPERFSEKICKELERDKGPYAWAGQYQQDPAPRGGAIIREEYWQEWTETKFPECDYILASLDTAYTEKQENDASALSIWGMFKDEAENPKIILMHCWEERLAFSALVEKVINTCTIDRRPLLIPRFKIDRLIVEAKAAGMSVAQEIHKLVGFSGQFGIELINVGGKNNDKVARVHSIEHLFRDGMVYAPDRQYADKMIKQCAVFPKGAHDDLVDSMSMALRYLRDTGFAVNREEASLDRAEQIAYKPRMQALYPC